MFTTLLESKARKSRSPGGLAVSAALHVLILFLAVRATLHASQPAENPERKIELIDVKKDEPPPNKPSEVVVALPPRGFQTLTAPLNIPDVLPTIDLSRPPTNAEDFSGKDIPGGRANGVTAAAPVENRTYAEYQVEKPATAVQGSLAPRYPDILKAAGVEGVVVVSFVVDTTGRVDLSQLSILKSTHPLFDAAVRAALPGMRFLPAEVGGRKVRQLVQQPFAFHIVR